MELTDLFKNYLQRYCNIAITSWDVFEQIFTVKHVRKGEHFMSEGSKTDEIAVVSKGLFRNYVASEDGLEKTITFAAEGNVLANDHFIFAGKKAKFNYQAIEHSELYVVKYSELVRLLDQDIRLNQIYRNILQEYLMVKSERLIDFLLRDATERLDLFLERSNINPRRLPKGYLASYLGITPQSLSRIFTLNKDSDKYASFRKKQAQVSNA
jgi:CRP-like cAMP-binding protein